MRTWEETQKASGYSRTSRKADAIDIVISYYHVMVYRGGPHMRSLISIDFPAPEMEPESEHVVSAVYVP